MNCDVVKTVVCLALTVYHGPSTMDHLDLPMDLDLGLDIVLGLVGPRHCPRHCWTQDVDVSIC